MVIVKSPKEIEKMRVANRIVAEILGRLREEAKPGVSTLELDALSEKLCRQNKAVPAFKGYRGYPFCLCASVNEQVVHGFPASRPLCEGDILSMDYGVSYKGFFGDSAITIAIGEVSEEARRLIKSTEQALLVGISLVEEGRRLSDISHAIQKSAEGDGFSVVRKFVGHGIGRSLHEDPQIPNYGTPGQGPVLRAGMTLAIEPMVNAGGHEVDVLSDGWTAVTRDGSLSAHFEHTVAVTENGPLVLSLID
ncbi:MAG: type I methionyl aminopeptidase [Deltaproteobacteria bacterium]|nr:type I methionyl aminopeptidase [Deltaproteobacteria bacterium]